MLRLLCVVCKLGYNTDSQYAEEKVMDPLDSLFTEWNDNSLELSISGLYSLSDLKRPDVERVRTVWSSLSAERREAIMRYLVDISEANIEVDFNAVFHIGLSDSEPAARAAAIDGLWEDEDVALIHQMSEIMQSDDSEIVRVAAASSLGRFVLAGELEQIPQSNVDTVIENLFDVISNDLETVEVRRRALEAVSYSSDARLPDLIDKAYADPLELWRVSAVFAMGRSANSRWVDRVLSEMDSPSPEIRFEAARACGELEIEKAVPKLALMINDADDHIQEVAIWSLGQIGGSEAKQPLEQIMESEESGLHEFAEAALDELIMVSNLDTPLAGH